MKLFQREDCKRGGNLEASVDLVSLDVIMSTGNTDTVIIGAGVITF